MCIRLLEVMVRRFDCASISSKQADSFTVAGFGLNATFDSLVHSTCTSCQVKQDKSAYWTPTLNFMYDNGTTVMVEQNGGMLA